MTVSSAQSRKTFAGDGSTTSFGTSPVEFFETSNLVVYVTEDATGDSETLIEDTDYTVSGGDGSTGTVDLSAGSSPYGAPDTGYTLVIVREIPVTQEYDPENNDASDANALEEGLDRIVMMVQQNAVDTNRVLRLANADTSGIDTSIVAVNAAGKYLRVNTDGDGLEFATGDPNDSTFTQSGSGAVERTVSAKLGEFITPEDFGAVGDGSTDDLTAMTNFISAVVASTHRTGWLGAKTYAISGALPTIATSGVKLIGAGHSMNHEVGSVGNTVIKAITNTGFTMLTVAPTEGASAQYLSGNRLLGITFDCNSKAAKGVILKSIRYGDFDIGVLEATTTGLELNVATTLGEGTSLQYNDFRYVGRQITNAAVSMRLMGTSSGNPSFNRFKFIDIVHKNELGIIEENADNNYWDVVRVFRAASGSATNSIEWRGGTSEAVSCRDETFNVLSTTVAAIAKGTGTYTVGANNIVVYGLDKGNSTPAPTEETGTTVYDNEWRTYSPTITSTGGTLTSATATGAYRRRRYALDLDIVGTITTNGTGSGAVRITIPTAAAAGVVAAQTVPGVETASTGVMLRGLVTAGSANMDILDATGTYPGADGRVVSMSGSIRTAE